MEELFLSLLTGREKLNIIHDQQIILAVFFFEILYLTTLHSRNVVHGELLRGDVINFPLWGCALKVVPYCLYQVRFTEARGSIEKQWVIRNSRLFYDCLSSCM